MAPLTEMQILKQYSDIRIGSNFYDIPAPVLTALQGSTGFAWFKVKVRFNELVKHFWKC